MKHISLTLALVAICLFAHAQYSLNINAGVNRPLIKSGIRRWSNQLQTVEISPGILASVNLLSNKPRVANFGVGLSVKGNSIEYTYSLTHDLAHPYINNEHRSLFASLHPVIDINIDKKRYFHFMFNPYFNFMLWGRENGYTRGYNNTIYTYDNSAQRIKKFVLGFNIQLQARVPINDHVDITGSAGYSINNTPSDLLPEESGNISAQLGVIFSAGKKSSKDESGKNR